MKNQFDIVIVGAGASGMAAALVAAEGNPDARILVLEKNPAPGKKIRATGNGRCNISNIHAEHYPEAMNLLRKWGIVTRDYSSGLVYPYSESAGAVAEILAARMQEKGIELWTSMAVTDVLSEPFRLQVEQCGKKKVSGKPERIRIQAKKVILASGGKAGPDFGTIGDGYRWVRNLGHWVISPIPVLTPVDCKEDSCKDIAGTRAKGRVTLYRKTGEEWKDVFTEEGEIQFTATGLSGICVFNMTRHMRFDRAEGLGVFRIEVDLCPDLDVKAYLEEWKEKETELEIALRTLLREKLSRYVIQRAEIPSGRRCKELTEEEIRSLENTMHHLRFRPTGIHGWKEAQCTAGGVSLEEINGETQESLICPGLYITGELQDYDGPCGGYNLNHAWVTGARAGAHAAENL
ncbi:MAG: aminoacetone oxidase family FAD-binding enzyme [Eubacteriales bacterium]|nr:aminoacetone oxidase family FAD-binding enzyme [Eubacteriales bacterium]